MLMTALATPFWHGKVDEESFERLLQGQRHADALLCCGTTTRFFTPTRARTSGTTLCPAPFSGEYTTEMPSASSKL